MKRIITAILALLLILSLAACMPYVSETTASRDDQVAVLPTVPPQPDIPETEPAEVSEEPASDAADELPDEYGSYSSKEDVALYINTYGHLPANFITKKEAEALGWSGGSLEEYAPGMCIGGGYFGNYEGLLPEAKGREYHECDIDTLGAKSRGARRIVYSNDGLIYYTDDHYESFTLLYGEE